MDPFPAASRAALILENMPAATGQAAEVPDVPDHLELSSDRCCTLYIWAANDTSGNPLPTGLYPATGCIGERATSAKYFSIAAF